MMWIRCGIAKVSPPRGAQKNSLRRPTYAQPAASANGLPPTAFATLFIFPRPPSILIIAITATSKKILCQTATPTTTHAAKRPVKTLFRIWRYLIHKHISPFYVHKGCLAHTTKYYSRVCLTQCASTAPCCCRAAVMR